MYTDFSIPVRSDREMRNLSLAPASFRDSTFLHDKFYSLFSLPEKSKNRVSYLSVERSPWYLIAKLLIGRLQFLLEIAKQPREILRFSPRFRTETNLINRKKRMIQRFFDSFISFFIAHALQITTKRKKKIFLTIIYLLRKNQFMRVVIKIIIQWLHLISKKKKNETTQIRKIWRNPSERASEKGLLKYLFELNAKWGGWYRAFHEKPCCSSLSRVVRVSLSSLSLRNEG